MKRIFAEIQRRFQCRFGRIYLKNSGKCPICDHEVRFVSRNPWLRDHYRCSGCGSIPRERALMQVLRTRYPDWRVLQIHESSPVRRGASEKLAGECQGYLPTQYFPGQPAGLAYRGVRNENLEALTFGDHTFDLHITQDVFEHIFNAEAAFRGISRTLKPGGAHIFTVPLVRKDRPTRCRARIRADGELEYLKPPEYHGNPVSRKGSLVTWDWGYDIVDIIEQACGLETEMICLDDLSLGIRAEYIEVLVTRKPAI